MLKNGLYSLLLRIIGLAFCVLPVGISVIMYFPLWQARGGETVLSGVSLVLILLSLLPIFNFLKRMLRSPSAYMMWLISFALFFCLSKIADEMTVISSVGFVGNLIGALFFKIAARGRR